MPTIRDRFWHGLYLRSSGGITSMATLRFPRPSLVTAQVSINFFTGGGRGELGFAGYERWGRYVVIPDRPGAFFMDGVTQIDVGGLAVECGVGGSVVGYFWE